MRSIRLPVVWFTLLVACVGGDDEPPLGDVRQGLAPVGATSEVGSLPGSFAVTGDGAATYTLPLVAPPGRAGVEPALALAYGSRGGNGIAGVGWRLSGLSQIGRCPRTHWRDGETRPVQLGATDVFCLDGVRLVEVALATPVPAECAAPVVREYRTEPDGFAKVLACGADAAGPQAWIVFERDGRIRHYGSGSGRLDVDVVTPGAHGDPAGAALRRPAWLLDREQDRAGNYLTVTYGREAATDRLEYWPERIDYAGGAAGGPTRSVVFGYRSRTDAWSSYLRGLELPHTRLLETVTTHAPGSDFVRRYTLGYTTSPLTGRALLEKVTACAGAGGCLPATRFTYSTATPAYAYAPQGNAPAPGRVDSLFGTDVDGDGNDDLVYTDTIGTQRTDYVRRFDETVDPPAYAAPVAMSPRLPIERTTRVPYDATEDGRTDLVTDGCTREETQCLLYDDTGTTCVEHAQVCVEYSAILYGGNANGTLTASLTRPLCTSGEQCAKVRVVGDADGDGNADLLRDRSAVLQFRAVGAAPMTIANPLARATQRLAPVQHLDLDGDGALDFLWPYDHAGARRYDALHVRGGPAAPQIEATPTDLELSDDNCRLFADVNGDGLADVVDVRTGASVRLNRGDGRFTPWQVWATGIDAAPTCDEPMPTAPWLGWKRTAVFPIDHDQDGLQDLLVLHRTSTVAVARVLVSNGRSFTTRALSEPGNGIPLDCVTTGDAPSATTLDADGDGLPDVAFVCADAASPTGGQLRLYTRRPASGRADLLVDVHDGMGALVRRVGYGVATDPQLYTGGPGWRQPLVVVASESVDDGDGNPIEVTRHRYADGIATTDGEGFLGFRFHTTTDPRTGRQRRVRYATDEALYTRAVGAYLGGRAFHPWRGEIVEEVDWVAAGNTTVATRRTRALDVQALTFAGGVPGWFPFESRLTVETYSQPSFSPDAPGTPLTRTITTTQVNRCGLPTVIDVERAPGVIESTMRDWIALAPSAQPLTTACDLGPRWLSFLQREAAIAQRSGMFSPLREVTFVAEPDGTGRVKDTRRQPLGGPSQFRCTRVVARDAAGNPTIVDETPGKCERETLGRLESRTRTTTTTYDADLVHVTSVSDLVGRRGGTTIDPGLAVATSETDADDRTTYHQLDGFGRHLRTERPDGTWRETAYRRPGDAALHGLHADRCRGVAHTDAHFALVEVSTASDGSTAVRCLDRLGRARRTGTLGFGNRWSYVDTVFDSDGAFPHDRFPERAYQVSRPHLDTEAVVVAARVDYDGAGRVTSSCTARPGATAQVTACTRTFYDGLTTRVCEPGNVRRERVLGADGSLASTATFTGATDCFTGTALRTSFAYGYFGQVTRITDAANNVVTQGYDPLGRRLWLNDRDLGRIDYTYSAFDEVLTETRADGISRTMYYDLRGRMFSRIDGTTDSFSYDETDRVVGTNRSGVSRTNGYDAFGRLAGTSLSVDNVTYAGTITYDAQGRVATMTTPAITGLGRMIVSNSYGAQGDLIGVELGRASKTCTPSTTCDAGETCLASLGVCGRKLWELTGKDAEGRITGEKFGNNVDVTRAYTGGYLQAIRAIKGATNLQQEEYTYRDNGSLATRTDRITNASETFDYDTADRLTRAQVTGRTAVTYQYDVIGNLTFASDVTATGCSGGTTFQYNQTAGGQPVGPHGLTNVVCGATNTVMRHDVKGNHTSGLAAADAYTWTTFDKIATSTSGGESWTMTYDADHQRVKKARTAGSTTPYHTVIEAGALERRLKTNGEQAVLRIPVGTGIAELVWNWTGTSGTQTLQYLHPDRLGSPVVVTTSTGTLAQRRSFDAWGNPRSASMISAAPSAATQVAFTGHEEDVGVSTGGKTLVDAGGRLYSPWLKRFWSPDPFVQAPHYGPSWNRFSYTFNNPLKFTDPSGYTTATFFAPILFPGAAMGETWAGSAAVAAANEPDGELVTSWDGKTIVTYYVAGSTIEATELIGLRWISVMTEDGPMDVQEREIRQWTIQIRLDAPVPSCPRLGSCLEYEAAAGKALQNRRAGAAHARMRAVGAGAMWAMMEMPLPGVFDEMRDLAFDLAQALEGDPSGFDIAARRSMRRNKHPRYPNQRTRDLADAAQIDDDGSFLCPYCGIEMVWEPGQPNSRQHDHVIAHALGGSSDLCNIVSCCQQCNGKKGKQQVWRFIFGKLAGVIE